MIAQGLHKFALICNQQSKDEDTDQEFCAIAPGHIFTPQIHANSTIQNEIKQKIREPLKNSRGYLKFSIAWNYFTVFFSQLQSV
jgi:hypothetical protein